MKEARNYGGVDRFRIIGALIVIAIHISPLSSVNSNLDFVITRIIGRIAVPFFFMTSGYFILPRCIENRFFLYDYLKRIGKYYFIGILIYLPINIYGNQFSGESTIANIVKKIVFDGTFYHLWFFPALIIGTAIVSILCKKCKMRVLFIIVLSLYVVGLFGDSYYGIGEQIPSISLFYNTVHKFSSFTRNGIFYAPIFLVMGLFMHGREKDRKSSFAIVGVTVSLIGLIVEGMVLQHFHLQRHDSMYILLVPCMYFVFQILLVKKDCVPKCMRQLSLWIYIIHPLVIVIIRGIAKITNTKPILVNNSVIFYISVSIASVLFSIAICNFIRKMKHNTFRKGRGWIELDIRSLKSNLLEFRKIMSDNCEFMPAVKANAYGHSAKNVARELSQMGIESFCVASLSEGIELRREGVCGTVLILGYTHPMELDKVIRYDLTQTIIDYNYAKELARYGKKIKVHLAIDTGMHRLGVNVHAVEETMHIFSMKSLVIEGVFTHLCVADSQKTKDRKYTHLQIQSFYELIDIIEKRGIKRPKIHVQSSYGMINYSDMICDYFRIGIAMYGVLSTSEDKDNCPVILQPVLSLKARVSVVRGLEKNESAGYGLAFTASAKMIMAVIAIGYADGIPRNLSCGGQVLLHGKRAIIIGRICMDQLLVDVSNIPNVKQGDVAVLIGRSGDEEITVMDIAQQTNTISNEILSRLGTRLERVIK